MHRSIAVRLSLVGLALGLHLASPAPSVAQDQSTPPAPAAAPPAAPADPATLAAAHELMDAIGASKNFDNLLKMLKTHVSSGADGTSAKSSTDAFDKLVDQFDTYKKQMTDETAALYASKFSVAELQSVTEFYRSGAGARFIAEMPALMEQAGDIGQKYAVQMMKDLKAAKDAGSSPQ